ncbi:endo alpha-1,4 polygalactosaminidase [Streptomyces sp. NBC_01356]|uniref:endo alpha-1,4 polygalactosaminidase n=1 Tax=Streptomyces sp. NBC_01356 TaxID=2903836 RepID=UPI002E339D79|nr:endo alpha-1,4 polygalactosaminidase [Streptomyces sp. NBC_01356]
MSVKRVARVGGLGTVAVLAALSMLVGCGSGEDEGEGEGADAAPRPSGTTATSKPTATPTGTATTEATPPSVELPPLHAGFDYQIGGAYPPPSGVRIVSRDRSESPAPGLYNICYVNAFQVQPGEEKQWPADLLLRDAQGELVVDGDWDEVLLDIRTPAKRKRVAARVDQWIDGCADKGFDAVEPDNYDSYTRSQDLLTAEDATAFITLLSAHSHTRDLAIAQKNTVELAGLRARTGLDFAVAEECGEYDECGAYAKAFDDRVVVIEYTDSGLCKARSGFGDRLSIVRRDVMVSTPGDEEYVRKTR